MTIISPVSDYAPDEIPRLGILALDQSTVAIGHSTWVHGKLESYGLFEPDWPRLDKTRAFVKDYCFQFVSEGLIPVVVCEDIFYGKNIVTYRALATLMGHIQAACFDSGGRFGIVTAHEALYAATGVKSSPRKEKKQLVIDSLHWMTGAVLKEDVADSISIGMAFLRSLGIIVQPISK